jgi:hypothetical protein
MKHLVDVTFTFTIDAPEGTDSRELEREVTAAARNALDAGMVSLSGERFTKKLAVRAHNVTASGLRHLWRWSREIPKSHESTLVALLVAATLRDRHEVLSPDQQHFLDVTDDEVNKGGRQ